MKKLVLEITSHAGDGSVTHRMIESFPATLGRGYHNDIILTDPHVSAQHVRVEYDADGWTLHDLSSENGVFVNGKLYRDAAVRVKSGDIVRLGATEIRAYDPLHPVAAPQRLQRAHPFMVWLSRPVNVWASFVVALGTAAGWTYLENWNDEPGQQVAGSAAGALTFILIWAGLWAVAGKLIRHKSRFRSHVALISLVIIASTSVLSFIEGYVDFLSNENWLGGGITSLLSLALLIGLLYGSLSLATDMPRRRRINAASYFSIGIMIGAYALTQLAEHRFIQQPQYPSQLKPYFAALAPGETLDGFMASSDKLFDSSAFAGKDKAK